MSAMYYATEGFLHELRIGSIFIDSLTGKMLTVSDLIKDEKKIVFDILPNNDIPLPDGWSATPAVLTSDWLTKFGFIMDHKNAWIHKETKFCIFKMSDGKYMWDFNSPEVQYVHQLQNVLLVCRGFDLQFTI